MHLREGDEREAQIRAAALLVWPDMRALLEPIAKCFGDGEQPLAAMIATLRETAQALCGDMLWAGPAGRAAAELLAELEVEAANGPPTADPASVAPLLRTLMEEVAVRPPQGGHPRLAIYGLIEARLQTADLMILGGLNEGTWPGHRAARPVARAAHPRRARAAGAGAQHRRRRARFRQCAGRAAGADHARAARWAVADAWRRGSGCGWRRWPASGSTTRPISPTGRAAIDDPGEHVPADRPRRRRTSRTARTAFR